MSVAGGMVVSVFVVVVSSPFYVPSSVSKPMVGNPFDALVDRQAGMNGFPVDEPIVTIIEKGNGIAHLDGHPVTTCRGSN